MGIRTPDLLIANETLYQLSYTPVRVKLSQVGFDSSLRGRSDFSGDGQSDQAEGHRAGKEKFKSCLVEFVVEVGRGGEFGDAPREVAKGVALAAEELGDPGHEMKQVKVPKEFQWKGRRTKFQQGKDSACLEDPMDF